VNGSRASDERPHDLQHDAQEVVEHLQAAALELIAAARAMLDIAEDMVKDPAQAMAMASAVAHVAQAASPPTGSPRDHSRVQHIRVS
jgi:malate/lactate dehydrogenase